MGEPLEAVTPGSGKPLDAAGGENEKSGMEKSIPLHQRLWMELKTNSTAKSEVTRLGINLVFSPASTTSVKLTRHRPGQTDGIGQATVAFGLLASRPGWGRNKLKTQFRDGTAFR